MYIWTGRRRPAPKKRNKSARLRAKMKARNRRRVNGMHGKKLGRRL
jgi:hypothetical protein